MLSLPTIKVSIDWYQVVFMPNEIHGGDKLTDLPEAPSATENGGTQATYGIGLL